MKLQKELPYAVERLRAYIAKWGEENAKAYMRALHESGEYQNFEVRVANDIVKYGAIGCNKVCEWYDQYQCHDSHVTTLCIAAMKEVGLLPYKELKAA